MTLTRLFILVVLVSGALLGLLTFAQWLRWVAGDCGTTYFLDLCCPRVG